MGKQSSQNCCNVGLSFKGNYLLGVKESYHISNGRRTQTVFDHKLTQFSENWPLKRSILVRSSSIAPYYWINSQCPILRLPASRHRSINESYSLVVPARDSGMLYLLPDTHRITQGCRQQSGCGDITLLCRGAMALAFSADIP